MPNVSLTGPVGLRNRTEKVRNLSVDQRQIISLLSRIPESNGGRQAAWSSDLPLEELDGNIKKSVADAIFEFQKYWLGRGVTMADGVVDPTGHTLKQLNLLADGGSTPVAPVTPKSRLPLDILVRFDGATGGFGTPNLDEETEIRNAFSLPIYHATHQPIEPVCYFGGHNASDPAQKAAQRVIELRRNSPEGITIIIGASVGGLSALNAAAMLGSAGIRLAYIALADAAFWKSETPVVFQPSLKIMYPQTIQSDRKENYFQTWGHSLLSDLNVAELHGPIVGFGQGNVDLSNDPSLEHLKTQYKFDPLSSVYTESRYSNKAHGKIVAVAERRIDAVVRSLIVP